MGTLRWLALAILVISVAMLAVRVIRLSNAPAAVMATAEPLTAMAAAPAGTTAEPSLAAVTLGTATGPSPDTPAPGMPAGPGPGLAAAAAAELDSHYAYMLAAQRPTGAIAMTPAQLLINPYFANLAAQALLTRPGHLPAVESWLNWYLEHLNADGTIDDYVVREGQEHATGTYDSADSYAATYLSLVAAYRQAGGDLQWIRNHRAVLERVAAVLTGLTGDDGLTRAKRLYPLKLLMDNAEVWAGWQDWADVLVSLDDPAAAAAVRQQAARLQAGLQEFAGNEGYAWALGPLGLRREPNLERFYPDAVAQFFPFAFGVTPDPAGYQRFALAHPRWTELGSDHFPWLFTTYAARRAGDEAAVAAALDTVRRRFPDLRPPWYVAESAWLVRAVTTAPPGGGDGCSACRPAPG